MQRFETALMVYASLALLAASARAQSYTGISSKTPTGSEAISSDGLVAAYDFESYTDDGRLRDFGPFGNHGKVERTNERDGLFGRARVFTDLGDVVDLPEEPSFALEGPLTVAAWLRITTPGLHAHIVNCDDMYVLWTTTQDQYRLADTQANGITTKPGTVQTDGWHSVVAVLEATRGDRLTNDNIRLYVDGMALEGTLDPTWAPGALREGDGCLLGASKQGSAGHQRLQFEGVLDEVLIFGRALTDAEVSAFSRRAEASP